MLFFGTWNIQPWELLQYLHSCLSLYLESGHFFMRRLIGSRGCNDRLGMNVGGELGQGGRTSKFVGTRCVRMWE